MKTIKSSSEEEVKVVNQLMAALNMLYVISTEEEVVRFTIQAIKNVPNVEYCCICLRGAKIVIGDSSKDAEAILKLMINTPKDVDDVAPLPLENQDFELVKLQTSDRKYGYLLYSLKSKSDVLWVKPILSNFINIIVMDLERRWQKNELINYSISLEQQVNRRTLKLQNEIIAHNQTNEILKRSEKKFKDLFEKSNDALLILNNGIFTECNHATIKMLGVSSKKDFLNVQPSTLSPKVQPDGKNSIEKAEEMIRLALKKGTHQFEWIHLRENGESFPVEVLLTTIVNEPKNNIIYCVWRDITGRKQKEKELEDYRNNLESLIQKRTENLEQRNKELDEAVKIFVGREQKIKKLEIKIEELTKNLDANKLKL